MKKMVLALVMAVMTVGIVKGQRLSSFSYKYVNKTCMACKGSKRCSFCNGAGYYYMPYFGRNVRCDLCGGRGTCAACSGMGYHQILYFYNGVTCRWEPAPVPTPGANIYDLLLPTSTKGHSGYHSSGDSKCYTCHGSGRCTNCAGRGEKHTQYYYDGSYTHDCMTCKGRGTCNQCFGSGKRY